MINLKDNGTTFFYFDKFNMMLERATWGNYHTGDALWRTSLACYASNGMEEIVKAIEGCVVMINGKYRFLRHQTNKRDTCSRDQAIMCLIALKRFGDSSYYKSIIKNLDFRISKKFVWQDSYLWAKERYLLWRILSCYHFIGWFLEPSYSIHLFCWMVWSSNKKMKLTKWYLLKFIVSKENYLLRALLGDTFNDQETIAISELKPNIDFRWQRATPWKEGRELTEEEAAYNTLDIDVLNRIIELNKTAK